MVWMDVYEAEKAPRKGATEEIARPPLVPSEKNNAVSRRSRSREVTSRYKAGITPLSLSSTAVPRRCPSPSPNVTRTVSLPTPLLQKRAQSAERRRPSTPPSPPSPSPSTPVQDSSAEMHLSSRRVMSSRWPSTMRSLCVSFQSDTFSLPFSKKEKPVNHNCSDHALKPSANMTHKQAETPAGQQRKATPERKRPPLIGKNASEQSENFKPMDNSHIRLMDQHRWPSRSGRKVSAPALTRSIDLTDQALKNSSFPPPGRKVSPLRRTPMLDVMSKTLQKSVSEIASRVSYDESGKVEFGMHLVDDTSPRSSGHNKLVSSSIGVSSSSSERARVARSQSLPTTGSGPLSPNKVPLLSPTPSRGMISPSRTRPSNTFPSVSSVKSRSSNLSSVLSFIADYRRGKKGGNHIEDAHQLRLLYNGYLQWRYANARANAALSIQKVTEEETLYNVWNTTSDLQDSVTMKRINLQQLRQELKLNSVLNQQISYLDDWALLERDHSSSLSGAIEALEASTLRLPVTGGARADVHTVKDAVSSAVDVMQAMGSSICYLLSKVEGMDHLVSELADVAAQERAVLDEFGDLLASTAAMQVEENSFRTHLIQLKQALQKGKHPISTMTTPVRPLQKLS